MDMKAKIESQQQFNIAINHHITDTHFHIENRHRRHLNSTQGTSAIAAGIDKFRAPTIICSMIITLNIGFAQYKNWASRDSALMPRSIRAMLYDIDIKRKKPEMIAQTLSHHRVNKANYLSDQI